MRFDYHEISTSSASDISAARSHRAPSSAPACWLPPHRPSLRCVRGKLCPEQQHQLANSNADGKLRSMFTYYDSHRLGWDRLEYVKLTDEYQCPDWITSSRCVFSRITPEFSVVLTVLRSEFLTQPVTVGSNGARFRSFGVLSTVWKTH